MTFESLSHSRFDCKYHLVFVPKYRKKKLYGEIRRYLGPVFHELPQQKGCKILEGHMVQDHVHMLISIPPKYAVSQIVGYIPCTNEFSVFTLSLFPPTAPIKIRNRAGYYSFFSEP